MNIYASGSLALGITPSSPTTSSVSLGSQDAATYYIQITALTAEGESLPSTEVSQACDANYLPSITLPAIASPITGYNIYISKTTGTETLQNTDPVTVTTYTPAESGIVTGGADVPTSDTSGGAPVSLFTNNNLEIANITDIYVFTSSSTLQLVFNAADTQVFTGIASSSVPLNASFTTPIKVPAGAEFTITAPQGPSTTKVYYNVLGNTSGL